MYNTKSYSGILRELCVRPNQSIESNQQIGKARKSEKRTQILRHIAERVRPTHEHDASASLQARNSRTRAHPDGRGWVQLDSRPCGQRLTCRAERSTRLSWLCVIGTLSLACFVGCYLFRCRSRNIIGCISSDKPTHACLPSAWDERKARDF
eukprot:83033-Pleurochrysis_carterae.AAC.1